MAKRLTDQDYKIRHSMIHWVVCALGYCPDDMSKDSIMDVQRRFNAACEAGRMTKDATGHYRVTKEYADLLRQRNNEQSSS